MSVTLAIDVLLIYEITVFVIQFIDMKINVIFLYQSDDWLCGFKLYSDIMLRLKVFKLCSSALAKNETGDGQASTHFIIYFLQDTYTFKHMLLYA